MLLKCILVTNGENSTEKNEITTILNIENNTLNIEAQEAEFDNLQDDKKPTVYLNSLAAQNIPISSSNTPENNIKNTPNFIQKITNNKLLNPIKDGINSKLDLINNKFNQLNNYFNHPNSKPFVALQSLSPTKIWEKINNKGGVLSGPNTAIFGLGHSGNPDYPFAYRKTRSLQDNYWREELKNYQNKGPKPFVYQDFSKITQIRNNTYQFQHLNSNNNTTYIFDKNINNITTTIKPSINTTKIMPNLVNNDSVVIENVN